MQLNVHTHVLTFNCNVSILKSFPMYDTFFHKSHDDIIPPMIDTRMSSITPCMTPSISIYISSDHNDIIEYSMSLNPFTNLAFSIRHLISTSITLGYGDNGSLPITWSYPMKCNFACFDSESTYGMMAGRSIEANSSKLQSQNC